MRRLVLTILALTCEACAPADGQTPRPVGAPGAARATPVAIPVSFPASVEPGWGAEAAEPQNPVQRDPTGAVVGRTAVQILPSYVAAARTEAASNSAKWRAFKSRLDSALSTVNIGAYQGYNIPIVADFALGYRCLKDSDPTTAARYAEKAISILLSGVNDYQLGLNVARQFVARGDGVTTSFTLAHRPIPPTFKVYLPMTQVLSVVRGEKANGVDRFPGDGYTTIAISKTSGGAPDYVKGVDWQYDPSQRLHSIDWSLPGAEPAGGATYHLTVIDTAEPRLAALGSGYRLSGDTLTLSKPLSRAQAILVEYQYGTKYRQVGDGLGGFRSILVDTGYTSRNLYYVALAYDWLYDYPGLDSETRTLAEDVMVRWAKQAATQSYSADTLASNYGTGHYALRSAVAVSLQGRNSAAGQILTDLQSFRATAYARDLRAEPGVDQYASYRGGYSSEGPTYGIPGFRNLFMGSLILNSAGHLSDYSQDQSLATEVIRCLVHSQPDTTHIVPLGDNPYSVVSFPAKPYLKILSAVSTDADTLKHVNYMLKHYSAVDDVCDIHDLLFRNPSAPAGNWAAEPNYYESVGNGLVLSSADWSYKKTFLAHLMGNQARAGHDTYQPGTLVLNRGADELLVYAPGFATTQSFGEKTIHGNFVLIGASQGSKYGGPDRNVALNAFEGAPTYTYSSGDYHWAYFDGASNPASELTRSVLHVRPDYVFCYDRVSTTSQATPKQLQWYLSAVPRLSRDGWVVAKGASKLFGKTFSSTAIVSAADAPTVAKTPVNRITVNPASPTATLRYMTAFQTAPSATGAIDASEHFVSKAAAFEGVRLGNTVAVFGRTPSPKLPDTYSFTAPGGTLTHYIANLQPNGSYSLALSDDTQGTTSASPQGVLMFTTTGSGPQSISLNQASPPK